MKIIAKDFELEITEFAETLTFNDTGSRITLAPGKIEALFRFLGPLYEYIILDQIEQK